MSLYMLHTDIVADLIQGRSAALDRRIASTAPRELCISAVTRGELLCGQKSPPPPSDDDPIPGEKDSDHGDAIAAWPVTSPLDQATTESLREATHALLAQLTPQQAKALRVRFGIDLSGGHTLEKVGKQFELARERIRLLEPELPGEHLRLREQAHPLSRVLDQFLTRVSCLPWDEVAATHFARIAVELHRSGTPLGSMDTMIAGHAIAVGAVLVTNNKRHFARIVGLKTENWART
jgi:predicted nucleic acid-binding protein